jgi:hypothetical protein
MVGGIKALQGTPSELSADLLEQKPYRGPGRERPTL